MTERFVTVREVAQLLGLTPRQVLSRAQAGKLPSYDLDGAIRFLPSEIQAYVESRKRQAAA